MGCTIGEVGLISPPVVGYPVSGGVESGGGTTLGIPLANDMATVVGRFAIVLCAAGDKKYVSLFQLF